ncbi:superoxide dismutase, Fe [Mesorhizobium metallidurans STM 2683]|uniref:Superoxide dismutase n=1 Tax=Mesorhizobium metallidurans STM 2683 TaxID=1297569 RepID=M5F8Q3_9HYPH|nr:superoxide dismutase [Mesorhizobium metallidurans]CCV08281.1 superoxide dismutase, Fe [Mesorhizobium metallidurans STM 2683]
MLLDRRAMLILTGAAATATVMSGRAFAAAPFEQPRLPYDEDALAPTISARTVRLHYGKHHKGYFEKLNQLVDNTPYAALSLEEVIRKAKNDGDQAIFNNAGQAWNHNFYWQQFKAGPAGPQGALLQAIERDFGGLDGLKDKMVAESEKVFGTGWVWLVRDGEKLAILSLQDAGNPIGERKTPVVGIDVWEHAYYLDYENRRSDHVRATLSDRVNWQFASEQFSA